MIYDATTTRIPGLPRCHVLNLGTMFGGAATGQRAGRPTDANLDKSIAAAHVDTELFAIDDAHAMTDREMADVVRRVKAATGLPVGIYSQITKGAANLRNIILPQGQPWDRRAFERNRQAATQPLTTLGGTLRDAVDVLLPSLYLRGDVASHLPLDWRGKADGLRLAAWTCTAHATMHASYRYAGGKPVLPFVWIEPGAVDDMTAAGTYIANWLAGIDQDWIMWHDAAPFAGVIQ